MAVGPCDVVGGIAGGVAESDAAAGVTEFCGERAGEVSAGMEREESGGVAGDGEERARGEGSVRREGEGGVAVEGPTGEADWGGRAIEEFDEFGVELTFRGGR